MTRTQYITRTIKAIYGAKNISQNEYNNVVRMADEVEQVNTFDNEIVPSEKK